MCTGIQVTSKQKNTFWGRTQEFDVFLPVCGIVVPKGTKVTNTLSPIVAEYAVAGISMDGSSEGLEVIMMMDGMNEKGLTGGSFAFGNDYCKFLTKTEVEANGKLPIRGEEFVTWALLTCGSVKELRERASKEIALANEPNMLGEVIAQHYVFVDSTGESIVIEPSVAGGFAIYENKVGTFTNQPTFPWHVTNLQNYVGIRQEMSEPKMFGQQYTYSAGMGSGMLGIPGEQTSQARFVRATIYNHMSDPVDDAQGVSQVFHILNTADAPLGTVINTANKTPQNKKYTQYTSVYDLKNQTIHISTYENRAIQQFALTDELKNRSQATRFKVKREETYLTMEMF